MKQWINRASAQPPLPNKPVHAAVLQERGELDALEAQRRAAGALPEVSRSLPLGLAKSTSWVKVSVGAAPYVQAVYAVGLPQVML